MAQIWLVLCGFSAVFGEDNGDIVSYARHPRARAGYFLWYDCSDDTCDDCDLMFKQATHFGVCIPAWRHRQIAWNFIK